MERPRPSNRATMPPSRLGGLPASVPPPDERARGQLALPIGEGGRREPAERRSTAASLCPVPCTWSAGSASRRSAISSTASDFGRCPRRGFASRACRAAT